MTRTHRKTPATVPQGAVLCIASLAFLALAGCRTVTGVSEPPFARISPAAVMGGHGLYYAIPGPDNRELLAGIAAALAPGASVQDSNRVLERVGWVYGGSDFSPWEGLQNLELVIAGSFPALYLKVAFSPANGWEGISLPGASGDYQAFKHRQSGLQVYTKIPGILFVSGNLAPMLDKFTRGAAPRPQGMEDAPPWLLEPPKAAVRKDIRFYAPRLSEIAGVPVLGAFLAGSMFSGASLALDGSPAVANGSAGYRIQGDLNLRNQAFKTAALRLLTALLVPAGGKAEAGEGGRILFSGLYLDTAAIQRIINQRSSL
jgi:hypothetical protein